MPIWWQVYQYSLFPFDAAGLLTLLGVDEVNHAVDRLVRSRYLEFMPLLAPFVVTGNRFTEKIAGYRFYNITDGVSSEIDSGWLVRYLISQEENIAQTRSILRIKPLDVPRSPRFENFCALLVGGLFFSVLTALTILAGDWWGLGSTAGVIVSVVVRNVLVEANRREIDRTTIQQMERHALTGMTATRKTLFVTRENKMLTVLAPGYMMVPLVSSHPVIQMPRWYKGLRYSGWIAFISHIVAINQACFAVKVITTVSLVVGTIFYSWKLGCTDSTWFWQRRQFRVASGQNAMVQPITTYIGTRLKLELAQWPSTHEFEISPTGAWTLTDIRSPHLRSGRRQDLYAWLRLSDNEENSLAKWDLLPHERDGYERWWDTYQAKKQIMLDSGCDDIDLYMGSEQQDNDASSKSGKDGSQLQASEKADLHAPKRTSTVLVEEGAAT